MPNRDVSVIVPTFNRASLLPECLDSLLQQSLSPHEVIVVDDGSTDETRRVLEEYGSTVTVVRTEQLGKPAAINTGLDVATGSYIWIFDDDDVAVPDALERFVSTLEHNPQCGFAYSSFYYTKSDPETGRIGRPYSEMAIPEDDDELGFFVNLLLYNFLGGAAVFARSSCYDKVGGFREDLVRSQDYEMAVRLARRFESVRVAGEPTFHYRQHEGLRGSTADRFRPTDRMAKWRGYNGMFFGDYYHAWDLSEYVPASANPAHALRTAYLVRICVMVSKGLVREVVDDIHEVCRVDVSDSLDEMEKELIRSSFVGGIYRKTGFPELDSAIYEAVREVAARFPLGRMIRNEIKAEQRALRIQNLLRRPRKAVKLVRSYITSVSQDSRSHAEEGPRAQGN
jgi:glycosyltransferase involved in cell wall biosynthesis